MDYAKESSISDAPRAFFDDDEGDPAPTEDDVGDGGHPPAEDDVGDGCHGDGTSGAGASAGAGGRLCSASVSVLSSFV